MPKAKPYPGGGDPRDDEEKTTIESQWEEEASTTVEQGEVEKPPALKPNTNVTHTGGIEEPTVDDQHAPNLSAITPLRADYNARLAITQGNDTGQMFEIRPGKAYSVGRAIDNDIVLTDIAVSRKHFELRHEDGAWLIVDHRSGNGTVVNGNVEDNPFMLANGDAIEIGNTVFRFEQEKGPARQQRLDDEDEEELSTVAGKPLRSETADIEPVLTPVAPSRAERPKTLPPPMPLRSVGASQPPPLGMAPMSATLQPASTLPMPQMANRPPLAPAAPTLLGEQRGMVQSQLPTMLPTTIPGQGAPQRPFGYPQATEIPPHSVHAQMLLIQTQNRRGDGSTAHVPPRSFDLPVMVPMQRYTQPQISARAKYIAAAAAIAVVAAIATIGIVKSGGSDTKPVANTTAGKKGVSVEAIKPEAPKTAPPKAPDNMAKTTAIMTPPPPKQDPKQIATAPSAPPKQEPPKQAPSQVAVTPPKQVAVPPPPKQEPPKQEPPKQDPKKVATAPAKQEPPKDEPKKQEKKAAARDKPKSDPAPATKKVATADSGAAREKADDLYKKRKFTDASSTLASAARAADEDEARELRATAEYYTKLGKALNTGEAPAMDPIVAFENLRSAANYDANVGGFYKSEIDSKLGTVAAKAAFKYLANKDYQKARIAVIQAESHGAADSVSTVRTKLESVARDLYQEAQADSFASQNSKDRLKQIMLIVDSKSTWYQKAAKALAK